MFTLNHEFLTDLTEMLMETVMIECEKAAFITRRFCINANKPSAF